MKSLRVFAALNERVGLAGWSVLHPGQVIRLEEGSRSIVISGVTWSKPDLCLLDELAALNSSGTRVWFFNPDRVFPDEKILPGAARMVQTPVLAEYSGKQLIRFTQGGHALTRIREVFEPVVGSACDGN